MFLVTGATGNVGGEVVKALVEAGQPVRALTRDPQRAELPAGAEAVAGDLNQPGTFADSLDGVTGAFLLPGYDNATETLEAFRRVGVRRLVLLSASSAKASDPDNVVSRYMIASEAAVRESNIPWTILRPCSFMSNTFQWLPQLHAGDVVRAPFAGVPIATIDPADIAAVAVAALISDGHEGEAYPLSGPEALFPADRLRILAAVLGRDLRFEGQSNEEARAEMMAAMPAEYVDAFFGFFADGTLDESVVYSTVPEVTGRPARTFAQWATAHSAAFR